MTLILKKKKLLVQAVNPWLQEMMEHFVENCNKKRGLKTYWKDVEETISSVTKRQRHQDKIIVSDNVAFAFTLHRQSLERLSNVIMKSDDLDLDELIKYERFEV